MVRKDVEEYKGVLNKAQLTFIERRLFPIPLPPLERLDRYQARRTRSPERVVPIERPLFARRGLVRHPPNAIVLPELDAACARLSWIKAALGGKDDRAEAGARIRRPQVGEEVSARMPRWEGGREDEASWRARRGRRTRRERRVFAARRRNRNVEPLLQPTLDVERHGKAPFCLVLLEIAERPVSLLLLAGLRALNNRTLFVRAGRKEEAAEWHSPRAPDSLEVGGPAAVVCTASNGSCRKQEPRRATRPRSDRSRRNLC